MSAAPVSRGRLCCDLPPAVTKIVIAKQVEVFRIEEDV